MESPSLLSLAVAGYALVLLAIAWGFDHMARRAAKRSAGWRTGAFTYHENHDAWQCPEDQWLWPSSFDRENRVMRYRALPVVCNSCPVKDTCTTTNHGRELTREIDPWPHSESGRFHRGIALAIAVFGIVMPVAMMFSEHSLADLLVLGIATAVVAGGGVIPLSKHLMNTPSHFPEDIPHHTDAEAVAAIQHDRYAATYRSARRATATADEGFASYRKTELEATQRRRAADNRTTRRTTT